MHSKYEYDAIVFMVQDFKQNLAVMDRKGKEGWRSFSVVPSADGDAHYVYMEREIIQNGKV